MNILVIAEHDNEVIKPATLNTMTAALAMGDHVSVLVAGDQCDAAAKAASHIQGIEQVMIADNPCYAHFLAENMASLIQQCVADFTHIVAPATTFGKNCLPRAAALCGVGQISDIIAVDNPTTFHRPIYAGNAIVVVESLESVHFITVRPSAFDAHIAQSDTPISLQSIDFIANNSSQFISDEKESGDRPELGDADIVISGGRGLKDKISFDRLARIADRLGAAIGASRAAVDAGLAPNDWQVGQTGKIVAPKLYIAIGISGAIQHLAGMKDSGVIVAINKDSDAPIFQIADYGLVADILDVLPQWETLLGISGEIT